MLVDGIWDVKEKQEMPLRVWIYANCGEVVLHTNANDTVKLQRLRSHSWVKASGWVTHKGYRRRDFSPVREMLTT